MMIVDVINWMRNEDFRVKIMKMTLVFFVFTCVMGLMFTSASAQEMSIPAWIKNNAGWWAEGLIPDSAFVSGIQWLISNDIMNIPPTEQGEGSDNVIPAWIKNNAGWWSNGEIPDSAFVSGLQWLISNGIMNISS